MNITLNKRILLITLVSLVAILYPVLFHVDAKKEPVPQLTNIAIIRERELDCISATKYIFGEKWQVAYAVMMSEGKNNPHARNVNSDARRTIDRGCWQLNAYWHKEVSDSCAYDALCSTKEAYRISHGGTNWREWYGYGSRDFYRYLREARLAS